MVAAGHPRECAEYVQPPDYEGPREWDRLEPLRWLVNLLGLELAGLAGPHQLSCVVERRRPVESAAECLANEGS